MNFVPGLTSAMDAESHRRYQDAAAQEMVQRQARLAAEEARIAEEHRRAMEDRDRDRKIGLSAIETLAEMQQLRTPPTGPQSPAPGQASVPMVMPPEPGMEGGTPQPMGGMTPPPPAAMSPSWQASQSAPEELGGIPTPPPGIPGAPPMAEIAPPPMQSPQLPRELPAQWLSVPNAIAAMKKVGVPTEQQYQTLQKVLPIIQRQNAEAVTDLKMQIYVAGEMRRAQETAIREFRAHNPRAAGATDTAAIRNDKYFNGGAGGVAQSGHGTIVREDPNQPFTQEERDWIAQNGGPGGAPGARSPTPAPAARGGAATKPAGITLTPEALDDAADQYNRTNQIPAIYRDADSKKAIMNRAAERKRAGEDSGIAGDRAQFGADRKSYEFAVKRTDAIDTSIKKIEKDAVTLERVLDKGGAWTQAQFANVPINKLRRQFNDTQLGKLDLAAQQVGTEYERMMNSGLLSVAQLHEGAREDAKKLINGDMPPSMIRAKLEVMRTEMNNAKESAAEQQATIRARMRTGSRDEPGGKPAASSAGAPKKIKNDAEYDALAPGTVFIAPDGSTRTKPK